MYLFGPHRVFVAAWAFLSLVAAASGVTLPVVLRVPIALALLAALGPRSTGASRCSTRAQRVRRTGFSCSEARASFPHLGSNPCPLYWRAGSYPLGHQGNPFLPSFKSPVLKIFLPILKVFIYFFPSIFMIFFCIKKSLSICPLSSTGNSARCYVAAWMGGEFGGEWIHVCVRLSPFAVHLKLSGHC